MEAELDELLDDVERRFCRNVSVATAAAREDAHEAGGRDAHAHAAGGRRGQRQHSAVRAEQPTSSVTDDIDALLEELLEDGSIEAPPLETQPFPRETCGEKKLSGRKCCPVFVGGVSVTSGVGTASSKRSCDQLRCTSCDFRVLTFDDCEWDSSCDYLFLRNNMPDREKLRARLRKRRGLRAFSCQCSWLSASEPTDLRDRPGLHWVCGRHPD